MLHPHLFFLILINYEIAGQCHEFNGTTGYDKNSNSFSGLNLDFDARNN